MFITSNNEKELPDAFLRRCFFHYIKFPEADTMRQIVDVHFPTLKGELLSRGDEGVLRRAQPAGPEEKPSTSELIDWLKLLVAEDIPLEALQSADDKVSRAAAGGRAAEERAGREPVREAGLHEPAQPLVDDNNPGTAAGQRRGRCRGLCRRGAAGLLGWPGGWAWTFLRPATAPPACLALPWWAWAAAWACTQRGAGERAAKTKPLPQGPPPLAQWLLWNPLTLRERGVRLEPLDASHEAGLRAAAADGELWKLRITSVPEPGKHWQIHPTMPCDMRAEGNRFAFAVVDDTTGTVLGTTSYHDILPAVKRVEIGYTWYAKSVQRTHVNTTAKLLMMGHAFDTLGCPVVGWRTDNFNFAIAARHRAAGGQEDGVIRGHALRRDGTIRDTVMYSMRAGEWPEAKAQLLYLLERHALA